MAKGNTILKIIKTVLKKIYFKIHASNFNNALSKYI
jgi:hypothetical protein